MLKDKNVGWGEIILKSLSETNSKDNPRNQVKGEEYSLPDTWYSKLVLIPVFIPALMFACGTILPLIQNLIIKEPTTTLIFDSGHYLLTVKTMLKFAAAYIHHLPTHDLADQLRSLISLDGPVLTGFYFFVFGCFGWMSHGNDAHLVLVCQAIMNGLSCVLIWLGAVHLVADKKAATVAALLWAFYPGAIAASSLLLTEPLAVILLLSLIWIAPQIKDRVVFAGGAGVLIGLLILLKPPLLLGMIASAALLLWRCRAQWRNVACLILALTLTLAPWFYFTQKTTGKASLVVQRLPVHNVVIGNDLDTNGWQVIPPSPLERMFSEKDNPLGVLEGLWFAHPQELSVLTLKKISRLFGAPWNDYGMKVFGLSYSPQTAYHGVILFAGIAGACLLLTRKRLLDLDVLLVLLICCSSASYLVFEGCARYVFVLVPLLCIVGATTWSELLSGRLFNVKGAMISVASLLLMIGVMNLESILSFKYEVAHKIEPGSSFAKTIDFSNSSLPTHYDGAFLLVDGSSGLESCRFELNDHKLQQPILLRRLDSITHPIDLNQLGLVAEGMGIGFDQLRQWRAIPIDPSSIKRKGANLISITTADQPVTVYGDDGVSRKVPSLIDMYVSRLFLNPDERESRVNNNLVCNSSKQESFLVPSIHTPPQLLPGRLRVDLAFALSNSPKKQSANKEQLDLKETFEKKLDQKNFDIHLWDSQSTLRMNSNIYRATSYSGTLVKLPALKKGTFYRFELGGISRSPSEKSYYRIEVYVSDAKERFIKLLAVPAELEADWQWRSFNFSDILPATCLEGPPVAVEIRIAPLKHSGFLKKQPCDVLLRDLILSVQPVDYPDLATNRLLVY
jgi:hypothetical protein